MATACDPSRPLQECPGARAGKCPKECFLSDFGHLARSALKSTSRSAFSAFRGPERCPKGTPWSTLWGTPSQVPKINEKSTLGGTFRPEPQGTPVEKMAAGQQPTYTWKAPELSKDTAEDLGCSFFAYSWKLPAYNGAFLLTVDNFSLAFMLTIAAFALTIFAFLLTVGACLQCESASNTRLKGL